jgi:ligand-binding sensor protein
MMRGDVLRLQPGTDIDWAGLERALADRFGVNAVTLDKKGDRKTAMKPRWANDLCALIQASPRGADRICRTLQLHLMHEAAFRKRTVAEECAAGIFKLMIPIASRDEVEGFVSICGRPYLSTDRIYTGYIRETVDVNEETINGLLRFLSPIDYPTLRRIKHFIALYPGATLH